MTSFPPEQESIYHPPSSPLVSSSALSTQDIHQEHGMLFPTLPSMTVFKNSIDDLLGSMPRPPGNDSDSDIFSSDIFSLAPAGPSFSPQNQSSLTLHLMQVTTGVRRLPHQFHLRCNHLVTSILAIHKVVLQCVFHYRYMAIPSLSPPPILHVSMQ
jgi:hypothetical protein